MKGELDLAGFEGAEAEAPFYRQGRAFVVILVDKFDG